MKAPQYTTVDAAWLCKAMHMEDTGVEKKNRQFT